MTPIHLKAIILDTETTGLKAPEPVEVAYIALAELENYPNAEILSNSHHTFNSRFRNRLQRISREAQAIHGISEAAVADRPYFKLELLALPEHVEYLICHNVQYDYRVLGKPDELGLKKICTVKLARLLWPELTNHKLTTIIEYAFPEIHTQLTAKAHSALVDCKLCLLILHKALSEFEINSWEDFYELAGVA